MSPQTRPWSCFRVQGVLMLHAEVPFSWVHKERLEDFCKLRKSTAAFSPSSLISTWGRQWRRTEESTTRQTRINLADAASVLARHLGDASGEGCRLEQASLRPQSR